jgi:hypothetical protein
VDCQTTTTSVVKLYILYIALCFHTFRKVIIITLSGLSSFLVTSLRFAKCTAPCCFPYYNPIYCHFPLPVTLSYVHTSYQSEISFTRAWRRKRNIIELYFKVNTSLLPYKFRLMAINYLIILLNYIHEKRPKAFVNNCQHPTIH